jgi:hypothetical protein
VIFASYPTSRYEWNKDFDIKTFKKTIDAANKHEARQSDIDARDYKKSNFKELYLAVARSTYASSVDEVLSPAKDLVIPLYLGDRDFVDFSNNLTLEALAETGYSQAKPPLQIPTVNGKPVKLWEQTPAVFWRLNSVLNWQMLDRRIDE